MVELRSDERLDQLISSDLNIIQSKEVFSFSLDALLLGHFAKISPRDDKKIVDLCAGNGAVTLLLASQTKSPVLGVELQPRLIDMARRSVALNGLSEQVQFLEADIMELAGQIPYDSVDYLTCNPPYFLGELTGHVNYNEHYAIARHEIYLPLAKLIEQVSHLLKMKGKFYLVHRPERLLEIFDELRRQHLTPKRLQFVYPKANKAANMILLEAIKNGAERGLKILPPLVVHDEAGHYLPEVKRIVYGS